METKFSITQEKITELKQNEIFVFGSNLAGNHAGGAAKIAHEKFVAEIGVGEGITGKTYAFPTLTKEMNKRTFADLEKSAKLLLSVVKETPDKQFLITEVGCGIAGYAHEEIAPLFKDFFPLSNVSLPLSFLEIIGIKGYKGFDKGMTCGGRGGSTKKQYKENTLFEENVNPVPCYSGMHFCPSPLDVLRYYKHSPETEYAEVIAVGKHAREDYKVTTNKLKIKAKIKFTDLIKAHFEIVRDTVKKAVSDVKNVSNTAGYYAHANTAGYYAHANTAGNYAHANTAGDESHANTAGYKSHANTAGYKSHANTAGYKSHANTAGDESIACSLGVESKSKSSKGWIVIVDWQQDDKYNWYIKEIYRAKVGKHKVKDTLIESDTWYWFENGQLRNKKA